MNNRQKHFKRTKSALSLLLILSMLTFLISAQSLSVFAYDEGTAEYYANQIGATVISVHNATDLESAISKINSSSTGDKFVVNILDDIIYNKHFSPSKNKVEVTIFGNNHTINFTTNDTTIPIVVSNEAILNLGYEGYTEASKLIVAGLKSPTTNLITLSNSTLNMYDGVTMQDSYTSNTPAGLLLVGDTTAINRVLCGSLADPSISDGKKSVFNMYGGKIKNCKSNIGNYSAGGGAIAIAPNSVVNMYNNSSISGCSSYTVGGAIMNVSGEFNMYDNSSISDCIAKLPETMTIYYYLQPYFDTRYPFPYESYGGAIFNCCRATMNMYGGTIENCSAVSNDDANGHSYGGAVCNLGSKFNMKNGTIKNCKASRGGAVVNCGFLYDYYYNTNATVSGGKIVGTIIYCDGIDFTMTGGSIINNNSDIGGAIYTNEASDLVKGDKGGDHVFIYGGKIAYNHANIGAGGICATENTTLVVNWCTVCENDADEFADDICVYDFNLAYNTYTLKNSAGDGIYINPTDSKVGWYEDGLFGIRYGDNLAFSQEINENQLYGAVSLVENKPYEYRIDEASMSSDTNRVYGTDYDNYRDWSDFSIKAIPETYVYFHKNVNGDSQKYTEDIFKEYSSMQLNDDKTISYFYDIPEYENHIFEGWYYDADFTKVANPLDWNTTFSGETHLYAHWLEIGTVDKDAKDTKITDSTYKGFDLIGVQVRGEGDDSNYPNGYDHDVKVDDGLRFVTVVKENILTKLDTLATGETVEYGYATAYRAMLNNPLDSAWELFYRSYNINGIDTSKDTSYDYVRKYDCTSKHTKSSSGIKDDHENFSEYRMFTMVVTYPKKDGVNIDPRGEDIVARAYVRYTDANGLVRTYFNDYSGTSKVGKGCCTSYNAAQEILMKK